MSNTIDPFAEMTSPTGAGQIPRVVESGTARAARPVDVAMASIIQDPNARIRFYSERMGIPVERFGVYGGDIVYRTDTGTLQKVAPGFVREVAKGLGPSFPAAGSALGTLLGSPYGPPGMVGGGIAGATAGQTGREYLAMGMAGQRPSPLRISQEALFEAAGAAGGWFVGKGLTRAAARDAANMFSEATKKVGTTAVKALQETVDAVNKKYGTSISLTPAELTGDANLIAVQKALSGSPITGETMAQFAQQRGMQIGSAMEQALRGIAPSAPSREIAGGALSEAAEQSMINLKRARSRAGSPAYRRAFEEGKQVSISEFDALLQQKAKAFPRLSTKLNRVRGFYTTPVTDAKKRVIGREVRDDIDLEFIQNNVKESLDDMIGEAQRAGRDKEARQLQELQGTLLLSLDKQVPSFAAVRKTWGDLSRPIEAAEGGVLPILANKNIRDFEYMGSRFFNSASPSAIKQARENILSVEGGKDIWDAFTRGSIEGIWEQASKTRLGEIPRPDLSAAMAPARFWINFGQGEGYKRLKSALDPDQMEAMDNLLKVMEAASRAIYVGPDTAAKDAAKELVNTTGGAGALRFIMNPFAIPGALSDVTGQQITRANQRKLAEIITNSGSVEQLQKIVAGQGGKYFNERNMILLGTALAQTSGYAGLRVGGEIYGEEPAPLTAPAPAATSQTPSGPRAVVDPFDVL